jgi:hypothetical protein
MGRLALMTNEIATGLGGASYKSSISETYFTRSEIPSSLPL